jgi:hypothetical protein
MRVFVLAWYLKTKRKQTLAQATEMTAARSSLLMSVTALDVKDGGEGGIRTLETLSGLHAFEAC